MSTATEGETMEPEYVAAIERARLICVGDRVRDEGDEWTGTVTSVGTRPTVSVTWDHGGTTTYGAIAAGYLIRTSACVPVDVLPEIEAARVEWRRRHYAGEPCVDVSPSPATAASVEALTRAFIEDVLAGWPIEPAMVGYEYDGTDKFDGVACGYCAEQGADEAAIAHDPVCLRVRGVELLSRLLASAPAGRDATEDSSVL